MSDEFELYKALKAKGLPLKAIAVCLGHGQAESGNECDRVQGDFAADRHYSKEYTQKVDANIIPRDDFVFHGPNGGGFGWLQWTFWARKAGLWNVAKDNGWSVGSVEAAVAWFWDELHQGEYVAVLNALQSDMSIREMSDVFMHRFERPADQSEGACASRAAMCQQIYNKYKDQDDQDEHEDEHEDKFWPPRGSRGGKDDPGLCKGLNGADVTALQGLLLAHGYTYGNTLGVFGDSTERAVRKYQSDNGLLSDGIVGPMTWAMITKI